MDDGAWRPCAPGHAGPLCSICTDAYRYMDPLTGVCEPCGPRLRTAAIAGGLTLGGMLLLVMIVLMLVSGAGWLTTSRVRLSTPGWLRGIARTVWIVFTTARHRGFMTQLKQLIGFFQVTWHGIAWHSTA